MTAATQREEQVPTGIKIFVLLFLGVFVLCGLGYRELWPLTEWRLFSRVRTASQAHWQATSIDGARHERAIDFGALPRGYHGFLDVLRGFPRLSPTERLNACSAWARALRSRDRDVREIRVYRIVTTIPLGHDREPAREHRELRFTCAL